MGDREQEQEVIDSSSFDYHLGQLDAGETFNCAVKVAAEEFWLPEDSIPGSSLTLKMQIITLRDLARTVPGDYTRGETISEIVADAEAIYERPVQIEGREVTVREALQEPEVKCHLAHKLLEKRDPAYLVAEGLIAWANDPNSPEISEEFRQQGVQSLEHFILASNRLTIQQDISTEK